MAFEVIAFGRMGPRPSVHPEYTINRHGIVRLNAAAYAALGQPKFVQFMVDTAAGAFGFRAATQEDTSVRRVSVNGGQTQIHITTAILDRLGLLPGATTMRYPATMHDGGVLAAAIVAEQAAP